MFCLENGAWRQQRRAAFHPITTVVVVELLLHIHGGRVNMAAHDSLAAALLPEHDDGQIELITHDQLLTDSLLGEASFAREMAHA